MVLKPTNTCQSDSSVINEVLVYITKVNLSTAIAPSSSGNLIVNYIKPYWKQTYWLECELTVICYIV